MICTCLRCLCITRYIKPGATQDCAYLTSRGRKCSVSIVSHAMIVMKVCSNDSADLVAYDCMLC